jgi:uncharacterized membrane protein
VHDTGGPALIVVGYAQRAAVMMCLALLAGFVGVLFFGGAAKEQYGHTG